MLLDHLSEYRHKHLFDDTVAGLFIQLRIAVRLLRFFKIFVGEPHQTPTFKRCQLANPKLWFNNHVILGGGQKCIAQIIRTNFNLIFSLLTVFVVISVFRSNLTTDGL